MARLLTISFFILLVVASAASAQSLFDYQLRVIQAAEQVARMKADNDYGNEGVASIKKILPRTEQVQVDGQVTGVDNTWLYDLLDSYSAEPDAQKRRALLDKASGSLEALAEHLRRVQNNSQDSLDKSGSREKVQQILQRPEYGKKVDNPIAAFIKQARREILEFINRIMSRIFGAMFGSSATANFVFTVFIIITLVLIAFAVMRISKRVDFSRKKKKKRTILGEEVEAGATAGELREAALASAREGDFRSAVRKLYISLLYELAERNLIELQTNATNRDYLARVSRFSALAETMRFLTERFDHTWYGKFPSSSEDFSVYHARYSEALKQARSLSEQPAETRS